VRLKWSDADDAFVVEAVRAVGKLKSLPRLLHPDDPQLATSVRHGVILRVVTETGADGDTVTVAMGADARDRTLAVAALQRMHAHATREKQRQEAPARKRQRQEAATRQQRQHGTVRGATVRTGNSGSNSGISSSGSGQAEPKALAVLQFERPERQVRRRRLAKAPKRRKYNLNRAQRRFIWNRRSMDCNWVKTEMIKEFEGRPWLCLDAQAIRYRVKKMLEKDARPPDDAIVAAAAVERAAREQAGGGEHEAGGEQGSGAGLPRTPPWRRPQRRRRTQQQSRGTPPTTVTHVMMTIRMQQISRHPNRGRLTRPWWSRRRR
jgi:hypothetical protein